MATKKTAAFWNNEIIRSSRIEKSWRNRGCKVVKRYRNEREEKQAFNILYANTETIKPAVYSATPKPDVRKRFKDDNPVAGEVAELMERSLSFAIDAYDFDRSIESAVLDMLLPGRGVVRVRYNPTVSEGTESREEVGLNELGDEETRLVEETIEVITDQEVVCEYVYWEDFRVGPARNWIDVPWIAFRHKFTRSQFIEEFGNEHVEDVDFSFSISDSEEDGKGNKKREGGDRLSIVWEIWDKETREVIWLTSGVSEILETNEDPISLQNFFPVPEPLYSIETTDTLTPKPLIDIYEDLADELNAVQKRIIKLTNGLKLRGVYPNDMDELQGMLNLNDNQMLGIKDFTAFEGKRLSDFIMFAPIEEIARVITTLTAQRESIKAVIFEVTGISDILRGQTKASETLGAQRIKAQFGTARLENILKRVRIFARDLLRMKGEIIAENFTPEMLQLMTGMEVTPDMQSMLGSDILRNFNIDIETDSTVAIDKSGEAEEARETLAGIVQFLTGIAPLVGQGAISLDVAKDLLLFGIRSAGGDKKVEEAISRIGEEQPQLPGAGTPQQQEVLPQGLGIQQGLPGGALPIG